MNGTDKKSMRKGSSKEPSILPCNFRSAGRLSNESGRTLTTLHELLARNLTNSLDVYFGTGLEVRLIDLEQLTMEDFRARCASAGYMMPCTTQPSSATILIEMDSALMFTAIDLLLGGTGGDQGIVTRDLTEIDEEILEDVCGVIAAQVERVWQPVGVTVSPQKCIKANLAYRSFSSTEKIHRIRFEVNAAGLTGLLHLALPASLSSHIVRNVRVDQVGAKSGSKWHPRETLEQRMLNCDVALSGELPDLTVSVRDLARIEVGSVLTLSAPVSQPGWLKLEGRAYYEAVPVGQGNSKAMQLLRAKHMSAYEIAGSEEETDGNS